MINKLLIKIVLSGLIIILGSLNIVYAQGPDEEEETIVIDSAGHLEATFQQLGLGTQTLNQDQSSGWYNINLPQNLQISATGNYLDLITRHVPETPKNPAALRVEVNGEVLSTLPLTTANAIFNTVRIDLPQNLLQGGYNYIQIHLDTGDTCLNPGTLLDVTIDEDSVLSFGYEQNAYPTDLGLYPFPFVPSQRGNLLLEIPVTLVLPDSPTSEDLSAAATIAAGLGQASGGAIDLTTVSASDLDPDTRFSSHLIVIGQPDDNALLTNLELPLPLDSPILEPGQGVLEEIVSPWNEFRLMLIVSGQEREGLLKAGNALNRQANFLGMRGPIAVVVDLLPLSGSETSPTTSNMTLASLGYENQIAYGSKLRSYNYDFTLPLGWQLKEPPFFVLKFTHADILDPEASVMNVKLNGIPVDSTALDDSNIKGEWPISLPIHLLQTGFNRLEVVIEMEHPDGDECRDLENQQLWTVLSNESEIILPYSTIDLPTNLAIFPYPFSQNSDLDQTLFVLPDQPAPSIFDDLMKLAVRLGSASRTGDVSLEVAYASEIDETAWKNHHLILLGRPTENVLLQRANTYLPQPFQLGGDLLEPLAVDNVAFLPDPNRDAGLLEIIDSPWAESNSLLAITGTTDEGVRLAVRALLKQTSRLNGNLAVVEPVFDPFSDEDESVRVSTYAVDTRPLPPSPTGSDASTDGRAISEDDLTLLADRWWR